MEFQSFLDSLWIFYAGVGFHHTRRRLYNTRRGLYNAWVTSYETWVRCFSTQIRNVLEWLFLLDSLIYFRVLKLYMLIKRALCPAVFAACFRLALVLSLYPISISSDSLLSLRSFSLTSSLNYSTRFLFKTKIIFSLPNFSQT